MSRVRAFLAGVRAGYDGRSRVALGVLAAVYVVVAVTWRQYIDLSLGMDWLLAGIWATMTALLCWRVEPRRDLVRAVAGFLGGLCIESWGTYTSLWTYWTVERPPLWILPAWPVAALAIDRIARALDPLLPRRGERVLYWILVPAFVVWMTRFASPALGHPATWVAVVGMGVVTLLPGDRRQDLLLFLGGALLGIFLEYWGTSRTCWTYYDHEVPPPEAVVAHGFASVAFQRAAAVLDRWLARFLPSFQASGAAGGRAGAAG